MAPPDSPQCWEVNGVALLPASSQSLIPNTTSSTAYHLLSDAVLKTVTTRTQPHPALPSPTQPTPGLAPMQPGLVMLLVLARELLLMVQYEHMRMLL
jgi:hypothetical protein